MCVREGCVCEGGVCVCVREGCVHVREKYVYVAVTFKTEWSMYAPANQLQ